MNTAKGKYVKDVELPQSEVEIIQDLYKNKDFPSLRQRTLALNNKGWTLESIGAAVGKGRSTVHLWKKAADRQTVLPEVSDLPESTIKYKSIKLPIDVPVDERGNLVRLAKSASMVRGWTPPNDLHRQDSAELNKLLQHYLDKGVSVATLARRLGVTHRAIRARLERGLDV
jgi:hypothetical protein